MSEFYVTDKEQAQSIIYYFNHCTTCSNCPLGNGPFRCGYMFDRAVSYLSKRGEKNGT